MVVARKTESKLTPINESIEDLLTIPISETESVDEGTSSIPRTTQKRIGNNALIPVSTVVYAKGCGKRKQRQYENFLDLLSKGPGEFQLPTVNDFLPMGHRCLLKLLEECSIFEAFSYGCEDFFEKFDPNYGKFVRENRRRWRNIRGCDSKTALSLPEHSVEEKKLLSRIENSFRNSLISGEIPQELVKELEDKLVTFFTNNPRDTYMSRGLSPLQRATLGALSDFHLLLYKCHRKRRYHVVQVWNANYIFEVPSVRLYSVLMKYKPSDNEERLDL